MALSRQTIIRRLREFKLRPRKAIINDLTQSQKIRRVTFARHYRDFEWTKIIFSDESVISLRRGRRLGHITVWRRNGERLNPRYSFPVNQIQRSGRITIWGCFNAYGFGCLEIFNGNMNADHYVNYTLPGYLLPSIELFNPRGRFFCNYAR